MAEENQKQEEVKNETPPQEEVGGPVPISALPPEAQEQVKENLEQQADKSPSVVVSQPLPPEHVEAVAQALVNAGASTLVPVLVHALKTAVGALVDDLALNIKTVDLGAASGVINLLAGNIASAIKAWVNTLNYPAPRPGPQPYYPPQPAPQPQPYYPPQPQPQPQPAPYYPPQPPQPYYPPQPQPAPQPPQPPRGPEINVR